jgi:hypothetical protein
MIYELRDDLIARFRAYASFDEALAGAGRP